MIKYLDQLFYLDFYKEFPYLLLFFSSEFGLNFLGKGIAEGDDFFKVFFISFLIMMIINLFVYLVAIIVLNFFKAHKIFSFNKKIKDFLIKAAKYESSNKKILFLMFSTYLLPATKLTLFALILFLKIDLRKYILFNIILLLFWVPFLLGLGYLIGINIISFTDHWLLLIFLQIIFFVIILGVLYKLISHFKKD